MSDQPEGNQGDAISLARALSIPILAMFFASLLIYAPGDLNPTHWVSFPEAWEGESLRSGLLIIAIVLGLSCFPGVLIGGCLGWLIYRNTKLVSGSLLILRIGQWSPFLLFFVLTFALFYAPSQRPNGYFYIWAIAIPAVALGSCYQILSMRIFASADWQRSITETVGYAIQRALFISIVLTTHVWENYWVVYPGNDNVVRHYVAALILMSFLFIANWSTGSDIYKSAALRKQLILNDVLSSNRGAFWTVTLTVAAAGLVWHLLSELGYLRVSAYGVVSALIQLFTTWDIINNIGTSLLEIFAGYAVSGILMLTVLPFISPSQPFHKWALPLFSLTFAIPMILLPAWQGWVLSIGRQSNYLKWSNYLAWEATCVATLSFFPLLQILWTLTTERLVTKLLLAVEQALPFGFAAILYGEMMSATSGLGFAVVVATAQLQLEKGFAIFLVTLSLLFVLSTTLRLLVKRFFPPLITTTYDK
jgi:ABC-type nitrate/sulfonate/bicarbonate transport system permease component